MYLGKLYYEPDFFPLGMNKGIFVVNNAASQISGQIALYTTDLMLELEPIDRYAKMIESQKKEKEQETEKKEEERIKGTQPTHSLEAYAGKYEHPGYGMFSIEYNRSALTGTYNMFTFNLEHFHYDIFQTSDDLVFGKMKLSFISNLKGDVNKLMVQLEPAVDEIVFTKKPAEKFSETSYLNKFIGKYQLGEMTIQIGLKNKVLIATPSGQPTIELVLNKENEFDFEGLAGYSIKFKIENGKAIEMTLNRPNGVFTAKRIE